VGFSFIRPLGAALYGVDGNSARLYFALNNAGGKHFFLNSVSVSAPGKNCVAYLSRAVDSMGEHFSFPVIMQPGVATSLSLAVSGTGCGGSPKQPFDYKIRFSGTDDSGSPYSDEGYLRGRLFACIPSFSFRQGTVAWWRFDEGNGIVAVDYGPDQQNATLSGASWVQGVSSNAVNFSSNSFAWAPSDPALNFAANSFSWSMWFYPRSLGGKLVQRQDAGDKGFWSYPMNSSIQHGNDTVTVVHEPVLNNWNELLVTVDRKNNLMRAFLNGRLTDQEAIPQGFGSVTPGNSLLAIGNSVSSSEQYYGAIDELGFFDEVLSASDSEKMFGCPP
jgi:hypothetical protein